ncbi:MAG: bifunctional adenosylcobinamide kinase/adenosylcobinamide-phosphate guanylyltransferase [Deltaproteobacteria bacterium]|nr:bifunctional adenosylcobinamide kinase/adenosylcobinamide-phosphate guanylyltransferase [Deltaproteobacteria bacterium]
MKNGDNGFTFVLGGARSGKSEFALKKAESFPGPRVYLATAEAKDAEMDERIKKHKEGRRHDWVTIEEPVDVIKIIEGAKEGVILIDCLTLWITNLMVAGAADGEISSASERLAAACRDSAARVVAVSNEVGMGIVPEGQLARRFRDVAGFANQRMAENASDVWFVAAGIPLKMK